ncbi:MAG: adenine-specific methyltransferase EcoRI family protein, partial [Clostridia bacterium]|nr:adenine-specific methyltransferase EcoRI family protein [Clostridia bacterium]
MAGNTGLNHAITAKKDEFYTQLTDIEKEIIHYKELFHNKIVFCNCDDPEYSNFWKYFQLNFHYLGLKKLISTHYEIDKPSYKMEIVRNEKGVQIGIPDFVKTPLKANGDFRSEECIEILKEADIVVTNPPFSLFREYVAQLVENEKKFVIIGNQNALTYKEVFPLIKENKVWLGCSIHSGDREFGVPDDYPLTAATYRIDETGKKFIRVKGVRWYTNLDYKERHEELFLYKNYNPEEYPNYDNYDAINVNKVQDIPCDYDGVMGVPITFMDKYNPS